MDKSGPFRLGGRNRKQQRGAKQAGAADEHGLARIKALEQEGTEETKAGKCGLRSADWQQRRTEGSKGSKGAVFKPPIVTDEHGQRQVNRRK